MDELISVAEAARRLGITIEECYDLVLRRRLPSIASATGRRLVPVDAINDRLATTPA